MLKRNALWSILYTLAKHPSKESYDKAKAALIAKFGAEQIEGFAPMPKCGYEDAKGYLAGLVSEAKAKAKVKVEPVVAATVKAVAAQPVFARTEDASRLDRIETMVLMNASRLDRIEGVLKDAKTLKAIRASF